MSRRPWNASPVRWQKPLRSLGYWSENPSALHLSNQKSKHLPEGKKRLRYTGTDASDANGFAYVTPEPWYRVVECSFHPTAGPCRINNGGANGVLAWLCLSALEDLCCWWDHCWLQPRQMPGRDGVFTDCLPAIITAKLWCLVTAFCARGTHGNSWETQLPWMWWKHSPPWLGEWWRAMKSCLPFMRHPQKGQCWPQPSLSVLALRD